MDILPKILEYSLSLGFTVIAIIYFVKREGKLEGKIEAKEKELRDYAQDYKDISSNALKIITLADERLKTNEGSSEKITDIHRMVGEILDIERRRV